MTLITLPGPPTKCHVCGAPTIPVNDTTIKCTGPNCNVVYKKRKAKPELSEPQTSTDIQTALALLKQQFGDALEFNVEAQGPLVDRMVFVLLGQGICLAKVIMEGSKTLWVLGPNNQKIQRRRQNVLATLKPGYAVEMPEQRPPADEGLNPMPCAETEFVPPKEKP